MSCHQLQITVTTLEALLGVSLVLINTCPSHCPSSFGKCRKPRAIWVITFGDFTRILENTQSFMVGQSSQDTLAKTDTFHLFSLCYTDPLESCLKVLHIQWVALQPQTLLTNTKSPAGNGHRNKRWSSVSVAYKICNLGNHSNTHIYMNDYIKIWAYK